MVSKWLLNLLFLFSSRVVSDSLQLHGLQHARHLCSSLSPGVCSDSCPLSWWCHLAILFSVTLSSPGLRSFPLSRTFPMSWLFTPGSQSIGTSASALLFPMNVQGWFSVKLTDLISLLSKGLSRIFSNTKIWKHHFFSSQPSLCSTSYLHMTTGKPTTLTIWTFVGKVMSLLFNILSRFVIAFLPRNKYF